jgi:hypothetical protein
VLLGSQPCEFLKLGRIAAGVDQMSIDRLTARILQVVVGEVQARVSVDLGRRSAAVGQRDASDVDEVEEGGAVPVGVNLRSVGRQYAQPRRMIREGGRTVDGLIRRSSGLHRRWCAVDAPPQFLRIEPRRFSEHVLGPRQARRRFGAASRRFLTELLHLWHNLTEIEAHACRGTCDEDYS